jgi:hypothetical protein
MNDPSENKTHSKLEEITSELRIIRKLLTALLIGVAVLIAALLNPEIAMLLAIAGIFFWLLLTIGGALLNRAQRKRYEAMRFQELSGRSIPPR